MQSYRTRCQTLDKDLLCWLWQEERRKKIKNELVPMIATVLSHYIPSHSWFHHGGHTPHGIEVSSMRLEEKYAIFLFLFYFSIDFSFLCRIWWFAENFNSRERERGEAKVDAPPCCRANMPHSYSVWLFLLPLWTILLQGMLVLLCSCSSYTLI
jgi:hypothetical protein